MGANSSIVYNMGANSLYNPICKVELGLNSIFEIRYGGRKLKKRERKYLRER